MKAVILLSTTKRSMLAKLLLKRRGVSEVLGLHLFSSFFGTKGIERVYPDIEVMSECVDEQLLIRFKKALLQPSLKDICRICKWLMYEYAFSYMRKLGYDFIVAGDIPGWGSASSNGFFNELDRHFGCILHPLSGIYSKEKIDHLCSNFGIALSLRDECLLRNKAVRQRLVWLLKNTACELLDFALIKLGRHLVDEQNHRIIISRDFTEYKYLLRFYDTLLIEGERVVGLIRGEYNDEFLIKASSTVAYYDRTDRVKIRFGEGIKEVKVRGVKELHSI